VKVHIEHAPLDDILAAAQCELRTNSTITEYSFDDGVEHRRPGNASRRFARPQQLMGWQRARRSAQRMSRRRAWCVLAVWPLALLLATGFVGHAWSTHEDSSWHNPAENPILIWSERTVGSFFVVGAVIAAIAATFRDLSAFGGTPIVMRGAVVEKSVSGEASPLDRVFRALFGYGLVVNVTQALRIYPDGFRGYRQFLEAQKQVPSTRRIHRLMKLNEDVFLVCSPGGRAIATLSDFHDDVLAEQLKAVLDTAAAGESTPAPEPRAD
jgi:hypothetical protein